MTVPFEKDAVRLYLDECIVYWRKQRDLKRNLIAYIYIDAYQSMRVSLFGELRV